LCGNVSYNLNMYKTLVFLSLLFPFTTNAAEADGGLQSLINGILGFINEIGIPFLLGIAFLFFIINVIRYFVFGSAEEEGRKNAKNLAIYSVTGFVILIIFWGIVNLISNSIGLSGVAQPEFDYKDPDSVKRTGIPQNGGNAPGVGDDTSQPTGTNQPLDLPPPGSDDSDSESDATTENDGSNDDGGGFFDNIRDFFDVDDRPPRDYFWSDW